MKYGIVIPDGAADYPLGALGGKTPLEAAEIPNMDLVAREGMLGTVRSVPAGYTPGSDVAVMSILGCEPRDYYSGRAPLEAASMGIELGKGDWAARANLVTITDGRMADYSAGHIGNEEAAAIVDALNGEFAAEGIKFHAGKSYRNLMVLRAAGAIDVETTPPHDIAGREIKEYLPAGTDGRLFRRIMERAAPVLAAHGVNARRRERGEAEANALWLWGEGKAARFPGFTKTYGLRAAVITYVDLVAGICALAGWDRLHVPGATGYYDTDYAGKGQKGIEALSEYDVVLVHVEAPDEASHNGDAAAKVRCIEEIDRLVVGPLHEALRAHGEYRFLVLPDHYTLCGNGAHSGEPVPFAMAGRAIEGPKAARFAEKEAANGPVVEPGSLLMPIFLGKRETPAV